MLANTVNEVYLIHCLQWQHRLRYVIFSLRAFPHYSLRLDDFHNHSSNSDCCDVLNTFQPFRSIRSLLKLCLFGSKVRSIAIPHRIWFVFACICTVRRPLGVTSGFLLLDWRRGDRQEKHRECMYVQYCQRSRVHSSLCFRLYRRDMCRRARCTSCDHLKWILRIFLVHQIQFAIKFGDCDRSSSNFWVWTLPRWSDLPQDYSVPSVGFYIWLVWIILAKWHYSRCGFPSEMYHTIW
jgi:hypothetical protein